DYAVRFHRVSFTYPGREQSAVREVDLELAPGTTTAVVGPSGAGKTTLLKLLVRAYDPNEGTITVGGIDLRTLSPTMRTGAISHVSQDTTLFSCSVLENLQLANPTATREDVERATRAAHAHHFIEALPRGYDTPLGDRGASLSGGERQRLAIARALLKDAPILVLDEVTANVDPESELGIQRGIAALAQDRIVLLVAHRLRAVAEADRIVVVDEGRIVAQGDHSTLFAESEVYATLWRAQEEAEGWTVSAEAAC
ncbi:MAG: ATP-binding cassette domain-containing protein, partial [Myxococcota bacterium]